MKTLWIKKGNTHTNGNIEITGRREATYVSYNTKAKYITIYTMYNKGVFVHKSFRKLRLAKEYCQTVLINQ